MPRPSSISAVPSLRCAGHTDAVDAVQVGAVAGSRTAPAAQEADTGSVISGTTNRVVAAARVGARPRRIAANPATNTVFAILDHVSKVAVISGRANTVTTAIRVNSGLGETP